jgi:hypothetical protein
VLYGIPWACLGGKSIEENGKKIESWVRGKLKEKRGVIEGRSIAGKEGRRERRNGGRKEGRRCRRKVSE